MSENQRNRQSHGQDTVLKTGQKKKKDREATVWTNDKDQSQWNTVSVKKALDKWVNEWRNE